MEKLFEKYFYERIDRLDDRYVEIYKKTTQSDDFRKSGRFSKDYTNLETSRPRESSKRIQMRLPRAFYITEDGYISSIRYPDPDNVVVQRIFNSLVWCTKDGIGEDLYKIGGYYQNVLDQLGFIYVDFQEDGMYEIRGNKTPNDLQQHAIDQLQQTYYKDYEKEKYFRKRGY